MIEISCTEHNDVIVMNMNGEFYIESLEYAEQVWNSMIVKKPRAIGLNCKNITFIDSSAIGILVKFLNNAMKVKTELIFFDLSDALVDIFKVAKLGNFFKTMSRTQFEVTYIE